MSYCTSLRLALKYEFVDGEERLNVARIILRKPASQAFLSVCVAAFERFEECDRGLERRTPIRRAALGSGLIRADSEIGAPLVQRKSPRGEPLPERQRQTQQRERAEDAV